MDILFNKAYMPNINFSDIRSLKQFSSGGKYQNLNENWLEKNFKVKKAILTNSCTSSLEICAQLLNLNKGDEIIMPSYTFVSTANAFVKFGAIPVFVDININTMNIDENKIEKVINSKTKAIVIVHYAGNACEMNKILKIVKKNKLTLIEDNAHGFLSYYKKKPLGSFGDLSTLSFHETKNIHCGEGGALLINNKKFIDRAKIIRSKGTNREKFEKKLVKKYTWVDHGSNYGLSEINAYLLYRQLKISKKINKFRINLYNFYYKELEMLEKKGFIKMPILTENCQHNGHIFYFHINASIRENLINFLKKKRIKAVFHYIPLHSSTFGKKNCIISDNLVNTNNGSKSILRLPIYYGLNKSNQLKIINSIINFFKKTHCQIDRS